jgi:hypothetical protein
VWDLPPLALGLVDTQRVQMRLRAAGAPKDCRKSDMAAGDVEGRRTDGCRRVCSLVSHVEAAPESRTSGLADEFLPAELAHSRIVTASPATLRSTIPSLFRCRGASISSFRPSSARPP